MRFHRVILLAAPVLLAALATAPESSAHGSSRQASRPTVASVSPTFGSTEARQHVTIHGTGFTHVRSVLFGHHEASSVAVLNQRTIVAYAPAQAHSTRNVTVRTSGGTSRHVPADRYTYRYGYVPHTRLVPRGAPLPSDADGMHDADDESLENWSCGTSMHCVAGGSYEAADGKSHAMALVRDARGTSAVRIPGAVQALVDMSCVGPQFCGATGLAPDYAPVLATLTGGHWTVRRLPRNGGSGTLSARASLGALSCAAAGHCVFGAEEPTGGNGLIYTLSGSSLSVQPAPQPPGGSADPKVELGATSCATTTWCVLTGTYADQSNGGHTLAITLVNGTPHVTQIFGPHHATYPGITALECPAVAHCYGVGYYERTGSSPTHTEVAVLDAKGWQALTVPVPADVDDLGEYLSDISCPAVARCVGVGSYYVRGRRGASQDGLIVRLHGFTVTAQNAPAPTSGPLREDSELDAVSCHSPTSCVAVGSAGTGALSETLTAAGVWVPDRLGRQTGATKDAVSSYRWVACPAAATCLASGSTQYHFVETEAEKVRSLYSIAVKR